MDRPVRQHIEELENRIQFLSLQLMDAQKTQADRNSVEAELRAAQQALDHYRKALEFEKKANAQKAQ